MSRLYSCLRPLLFALDPEQAHAAALASLRLAHSLRLLRAPPDDADESIELMGLRFPNRVGLAAGFDKNGRYVDALAALGFGCIEVGTVTPKPQMGQGKPRLFRVPAAAALINRMGFPNDGAEVISRRLALRAFKGVCGVNIGKNATTALADAVRDYVDCFRIVAPCADYVAINISSPNTENLRRLQQTEHLRPILAALLDERERLQTVGGRRVPLLVKLSPDLTDAEITQIAGLVRQLQVDGVVAVNTTVSRPDAVRTSKAARHESGGLSGRPLLPATLRTIESLREAVGRNLPIIAVGGIQSGEDARAVIQAGASLVQIYTGLIYRGPGLVTEVRRALRTC
jgi:dihydroorotate dehydrogenase